MNDFDRYLLEDLVGIYDQGPEADDWEELYHRFENLSYLPETLPYLLTTIRISIRLGHPGPAGASARRTRVLGGERKSSVGWLELRPAIDF